MHHPSPPLATVVLTVTTLLAMLLGPVLTGTSARASSATGADPADWALGRVEAPWSVSMFEQDPFGDAAPAAAWEDTSGTLSTSTGFQEELRVSVSDGEQWGTVTVAAPRGEDLRVGTYRDVARAAFRREHEPGFDLSRNNTSCSFPSGAFTIHRLSDDLSTLHLSWSTSCGYGELRIGEAALPESAPRGTDRVAASPWSVDWPAIHQGRTTDPVPVHVANPSPLPLTVGAVSVEGALADEVDARSDCGVLPPGGRCTVTVSVSPAADGTREADLVVPTGRGELRFRLRGIGIPGVSRLRVDDEGSSTTWGTDDHLTTGSGTVHEARFTFGRDASSSAGLRLTAPPGGALVPGTYDDAAVSLGRATGAGASGGRLTILEATYDDATGLLTSMVATIASRSYVTQPVGNTRVSLVWRSHSAMPELPPVVRWQADPVSGVTVHPTVGGARIGFFHPPGPSGPLAEVDDVAVRLTDGRRQAEDHEDGRPLLVFRNLQRRHHTAVLRDLPPGRDHTVTFFVTPERDPRPPPTVLVLRGTRVAVTARPAPRARQRVTARLVDVAGRGLAGRRLRLDVVRRDGARTTRFGVTDDGGRVRVLTARRAAVDAVFTGRGTWLGGLGATRGAR